MSLLLATLLSPAFAQDGAANADDPDAPDDFTEVVLVWPDKFARWKDTRWLIATEIVIPTGLGLQAKNNVGVNTYAFQVRAIVTCDQDYKLGKKKIEVGCEIKDFALRASTMRRFERETDRRRVQAVLDEIDADLTGAIVQLQVNNRGAVNNIGIEGITTRNERERRRLETLRQIAARMFYPFHMKLPKSGVKEGNWPEFDSELMSMPSLDGITGYSTIVHWMNFYKGYLLVQDIGEGVVTVNTPLETVNEFSGGGFGSNPSGATDSSTSSKSAEGGLGGGGGSGDGQVGGAAASAGQSRFQEDTETEQPGSLNLSYRLNMNGVSIYNIDNGIMEERVWNMVGNPTASNDTLLQYWYSGRIQLLGSADNPDLGPTEQISYPGQRIEGLNPWLPVDPEMEKDLKQLMEAAGDPPPIPKK